jgi:hypothetical protein
MGRQRVAGFIFLSIGLFAFSDAIRFPWGTWAEPGPGPFPLAISILLCLAGIVKILQKQAKAEGGGGWRTIARDFLTPLKILGTAFAFILILNQLGYLLATPLFMFVLFLWVCRYRLRVAAGLAIVIGVGSWYFFEKILSVQLPQGLLPYL